MTQRAPGTEKLLFLRRNKLDECTASVAVSAARSNHFEIFQWLHANYPEIIDADTIERMHAVEKRASSMFYDFFLAGSISWHVSQATGALGQSFSSVRAKLPQPSAAVATAPEAPARKTRLTRARHQRAPTNCN